MQNCPKCNRRLPPAAAQCPSSDCHAYFDHRALIWFHRNEIKARSEEWERQRQLEEEEKALKKAARAAKKGTDDPGAEDPSADDAGADEEAAASA